MVDSTVKVISIDEYFESMDILNNWRSCHGYPVNTFQMTLRDKISALNLKERSLVAQRLKRTPSIINKLARFKNMELSRMQDIAGLRVVVPDIKSVRLLEYSYKKSRFKHELVNSKDYIFKPKADGYRCVHLVFKYKNVSVPEYNNLFVELKIRTYLQHAWATAVETMGVFLDTALKSSEGPNEWLEFFALTGSAFAKIEKTNTIDIHKRLSAKSLAQKVLKKGQRLEVYKKLQQFTIAAKAINTSTVRGHYHLIILDRDKNQVSTTAYARTRLEEASTHYTNIEKQISSGRNAQAVLVSAGSIKQLKKAYPNYFLDTREFLKQLSSLESLIKN